MNKYEVTWKDIAVNLRKLGLESGSIVLVHSSLSSFGYVIGGAEAVIKALLEVVGRDGTVLVPTLTGSIRDGPENPPIFSLNKPCWTGIIPEKFRKMATAIRSLHPTHSVAVIGPEAERLIKGHEKCETPCGECSPYVKLARLDGYILFLGVTLDSNTTFHAAEELAKVRYHLQPEPIRSRIILPYGEKVVEGKIHAYGTPRAFGILEDRLLKENILVRGKIGKATIRLVKAKEMLDYTVKLLKKDELALVKRKSVDIWSIIEAVKIASSEGIILRLLYYVPEEAVVQLDNNRLIIKGIEQKGIIGQYTVENLSLRLNQQVEKLKLEGGALYWLRISSEKTRVNFEILNTFEL